MSPNSAEQNFGPTGEFETREQSFAPGATVYADKETGMIGPDGEGHWVRVSPEPASAENMVRLYDPGDPMRQVEVDKDQLALMQVTAPKRHNEAA